MPPLPELAFLDGRRLLAAVGLDLFQRDLPRSQLDQDLLEVHPAAPLGRRADQDLLELQVVAVELLAHLDARVILDRGTVMDQLDERAGLGDVLEVRGHHRVERLLDEALDVAKALDHQRCLAVVDMDDHGQRQARLERVLRDQIDFGQVLVEPVRTGFGLVPLEDEVGRRDHHDLAGIRVERIFAGQQRSRPDTSLAAFDELAVAVGVA